jgi:hypothetical protein
MKRRTVAMRIDRAVSQIAAQLLVSPAIQHLIDGLDLRMQQGTEPTTYTRTAISDRPFGLQAGLI